MPETGAETSGKGMYASMGEGGIQGGDRPHARRRLTVAQAADQLGVTVDAIRSRVKRGTIDYVREGGRVYIMLGGDQDTTSHDQDQAQPPGPDYRDELLEELRDRVRSLEAANRENRRIIAELTYRIPAIEPPEPPQAPEMPDEEPAGTSAGTSAGERETESSRPEERRSRWRRWFGL